MAVATVAAFERGERKSMRNNLSALERVFREAGITFLPNDGVARSNMGAYLLLALKAAGLPLATAYLL